METSFLLYRSLFLMNFLRVLELQPEFLLRTQRVSVNHEANHADIAGAAPACEDDKYQNSHISGKIHGRIFL